MKKIVIMPGGFHPFHAGHMALYNAARDAFPSADVFVAATTDTSTRPFPFAAKKFLAQQAGVPGNRFIQVKSPFRAEEITQMYDPDDTVLIFVRSEKDADKQPQAGGVKKDGTPAYLQPFKRNGLEPFRQHGYMAYLPTVQFGPGMTSATEIRAKWPGMEPEEKISLVQSLYPGTAGKKTAAGKIVAMLDEIMGAGIEENMQGAQASLLGAPMGGGASTLNPTPTPMANAADRPRKGVRMGVEFDEQDQTGLTTTYQDGVTTRSVTPPAQHVPDPDLVRQKDELSRELRAQGMTGAQILRDPRYRELSRKIRGIEETDALKPAGTYAPLSMEGYNTAWLEKLVQNNKPLRGITPAQALEELRLRMNSADPDYQPSAEFARRYLQSGVKEATVINDPDAGIQVRPAGGMGTYNEATLVSNLARKFASMVDMVRNKNYTGLHHVLYRAGVVENMVRALAELERFQQQQGRRPIARGREIDITDYLEER
jgi:hypothetical protein